jgi:hypothetical protein
MMAPLKAGIKRAEDKRPSAGRGATDESRREAGAARMASLILAVFILFLLASSLHMFAKF